MDTRRNWLLVFLAVSSIAAWGCSPGRASGDSPAGTTNSSQIQAYSAPVGLSSANSTASASVVKPMLILRKPLASAYWNDSIWLAGAELDKNRIVVARARADAGFVEPEAIAATLEVDQLPKSIEIFVGHAGLSLLSQGDAESDPQRLYHFALHDGRLEAMGKPLLLEAYASVCATEDGVVFMELAPDATKAPTISMVPRRGRFRFAPFAERRNAESFTIRTLAENQLETLSAADCIACGRICVSVIHCHANPGSEQGPSSSHIRQSAEPRGHFPQISSRIVRLVDSFSPT